MMIAHQVSYRMHRVNDNGQDLQVLNKIHTPCSPVTQPKELTQQDINEDRGMERNKERDHIYDTCICHGGQALHKNMPKYCYVFLCCSSHLYHHPNC